MKRKEAKQATCEKCGRYFYSHSHHILPKTDFGDGETVELCPGCHTGFHEFLNKKDVPKGDMEKHLYVWLKWFYGSAIVIALLTGLWYLENIA